MIRDFVKTLNERFQTSYPLIQVVLGPRQVGKTFGVQQVLEEWPGEKFYGTADLLSPPNSEWILKEWKQIQARKQPVLLVLDEIQKIPRWSEAVKLLFDEIRNKVDMKVVLLGSASLALEEGLGESLAGRFEQVRVFHWDFEETKRISDMTLEQYLLFGGYPESYRYLDDVSRWQNFLQHSIIDPVITRDIQGVRRINKPALFRQTLELVLRHPAREISLQKMLGQLQDKGNVTTIQNYLNLFEGAYLIRQLFKYSPNQLLQKQSSPKIIPMCPALTNAFWGLDSVSDLDSFGYLVEANVGAVLSTLPGSLYYWRDGDFEVDYVWVYKQNHFAIEVKAGSKRRSNSLGKFLKKFPKTIPVTIAMEDLPRLHSEKVAFFSG